MAKTTGLERYEKRRMALADSQELRRTVLRTGGRPPAARLAPILEAIRVSDWPDLPRLHEALRTIALDPKQRAVDRIRAAETILNRHLGKPPANDAPPPAEDQRPPVELRTASAINAMLAAAFSRLPDAALQRIQTIATAELLAAGFIEDSEPPAEATDNGDGNEATASGDNGLGQG